jgi:hypothetical protein
MVHPRARPIPMTGPSGIVAWLGRPAPARLRAAVLVVCASFAAFWLATAVTEFNLHDMDAYWDAALRLRAGQPLYVVPLDIHTFDLYRYAPWFAYPWVPLTFLPKALVSAAWFTLLLASALVVIRHLARTQVGACVALLLGTLLIRTAVIGNVQSLLVASLYFGVQRRSGPLWIALAASLKAAPIVLVAVYIGRREWLRAAVTLALFGVLVMPMLWLPGYTPNPGLTLSLYGWAPLLYVVVGLAAVGNAALLARTRWAWLAGGLAVVLALPRLLYYDLSFLVIGAAASPPSEAPVS